MAFHTYIAHIVHQSSKSSEVPPAKYSGECLVCNVKSVTVEQRQIKDFAPDEPRYTLEWAKKLNAIGKVAFIVICFVFNFVFWSIAMIEYTRPAEEYIT